MPSECSIFFDNPDSVYYSGSHVSGRFELKTTSTKKIRGISVRITGNANVCWEEEEKERDKTITTEYTNHESLLNYKQYVLGSEYANNFELNPGIYNYAFDCDLPINLPSSFTGLYGEIIYEVCVEINRPGFLIYNNIFKQAFTVISSLDLNLSPDYHQPKFMNGEVNYTCCSCFFGSGNVEAEITIPHGGFVAGQNIFYHLVVSNDTNSDLDSISKVELVRVVAFESQVPERRVKYREISLDYKSVGCILRLSKKEFKNVLEIPTVPPTTINLTCCIRIEYIMKVKIKTSCCASDLRLQIPIVIGTVPLIESEESNGVIFSQPIAPNLEEQVFGALSNLDLPPEYAGPPSYEDAKKLSEKFVKRQISIDKELSEHVPKYPVFFNNRDPTAPYETDIN